VQTILVATDFSETAGAALGWATSIAREHRARLVVAHAAAPVVPAAPEFVALPDRCYDEIREAAQDQLDAVIAALQTTGVPCSSRLVVGPASDVLVALAKEHRADLVVAGTRGRTGWARVLLGSTAARLVRDAPCPVLTVHPADARHPEPVRSVLVATDFSPQAWLAAETAARLLLATPAAHRLVLLHAYRVPIDDPAWPAPGVSEALGATAESARSNIDALACRLAQPGLRVEVRIGEGYPPEVIVDAATRLGVDVVAMGTHGRSGLERLWIGSTAERVLPTAPCPVLTVRGR
jgi:nucleotide-binding universal stress UspA family protein